MHETFEQQRARYAKMNMDMLMANQHINVPGVDRSTAIATMKQARRAVPAGRSQSPAREPVRRPAVVAAQVPVAMIIEAGAAGAEVDRGHGHQGDDAAEDGDGGEIEDDEQRPGRRRAA